MVSITRKFRLLEVILFSFFSLFYSINFANSWQGHYNSVKPLAEGPSNSPLSLSPAPLSPRPYHPTSPTLSNSSVYLNFSLQFEFLAASGNLGGGNLRQFYCYFCHNSTNATATTACIGFDSSIVPSCSWGGDGEGRGARGKGRGARGEGRGGFSHQIPIWANATQWGQ